MNDFFTHGILSNEFVFLSENILTLTIFAIFLISSILKHTVTKYSLNTIVFIYLSIVAMRQTSYNTDTYNYSRYVELIKNQALIESISNLKIEPLHLALIKISENINIWLILEGSVFVLLYFVFSKISKKIESNAIILGLTLPLVSSSIRFSVGLMAIAVAILYVKKYRLIYFTIIGAATHGVLSVSFFFLNRKIVPIVLIMLFVIMSIYFFDNLSERAGIDYTQRTSGAKTAIVAMCISIYIYVYSQSCRVKNLLTDLFLISFLFLISSFISNSLNRFIILYLLMMISSIENPGSSNTPIPSHNKFPVKKIRITQSFFAGLVFLLTAFPSWISLFMFPDAADGWFFVQ